MFLCSGPTNPTYKLSCIVLLVQTQHSMRLLLRYVFITRTRTPHNSGGFSKCGLWSEGRNGTDINALSKRFKVGDEVTVEKFIFAFNRSKRSLLRDVDVEDEGRVRIGTANGAHLTSELFCKLSRKGKRAQNERRRTKSRAQGEGSAPRSESAVAMRKYISLADERIEEKKALN